MNFEQAHRNFLEEKARRESLEGEDKRLIEKIEAVETGRYSMSHNELILIAKLHNNNAINASFDFFRYGFLKGQRAAKAEMKRKAAL